MNDQVSNSVFWNKLWRQYSSVPSIALCRVPELEYASSLRMKGMALDHCCGDGLFASLAWPTTTITAGCDVSARSIDKARGSARYQRLDVCDASKILPYVDNTFDLIVNNSALEHINDLASALAEVSRVLKRDGTLAFSVLNHRYFEWWPLDEESRDEYRAWQPFVHALSIGEWTKLLNKVGLVVRSVQGYFDEEASRELALIDYMFSRKYMARKMIRPLWWNINIPIISERYWRKRLGGLRWRTDSDAGAGYFIKAVLAG